MNVLHDFIQTASRFQQNPPAWMDKALLYTILVLMGYSLFNYYKKKYRK